MVKNIPERLEQVKSEIRASEEKYAREAGSVKLLAVSKTQSAREILTAVGSGQQDFGENYLKEAVDKIQQIFHPDLCWHFIGPVQSNKTNQIAQLFQWVHSVDRIKIAKRLNDQRPGSLPPLNICAQVNISGEDTKAGIEPDELVNFAKELSSLPRLKLRGLMGFPAPSDDFQTQRKPFKVLRELYDKLSKEGFCVDTLSMGASHDMEAAIAEGSTIVRIGTNIFGSRQH